MAADETRRLPDRAAPRGDERRPMRQRRRRSRQAVILGRKVGMLQLFRPRRVGRAARRSSRPARASSRRSDAQERDGYTARPARLRQVAKKKLTTGRARAPEGHAPPVKHLREVRVDDLDGFAAGQTIDVDMLRGRRQVDVVGTSKGKGFQGPVKRHHFRGGPKTHGRPTACAARARCGSGTTPGRVLKGTAHGRPPWATSASRCRTCEVAARRRRAHRCSSFGRGPRARNGIVM